ncbi:hypothetical protein H4R34_002760 [Dimargaris verticillata]|uniref:Magnesium transporter NIPA-domain-containing protein n=1 Tax=Dimargaris verticillata TaxID=2761393 RepID=A0A9W8ECM3_9FUNG|nr:hypothetical protein H4R34_002760 [Dimargaris verticillata]
MQSAQLAIGVGTSIVTSFTQSLGLTLQRKSHEDHAHAGTATNAPAPPYYRRPLWLVGFALFLASSLGGSTVTITLLPVTILAPLGAVTLVSNALFARWLLAHQFSQHAVIATLLVIVGGLLVGTFGTLPLAPHDLDALLRLYRRPVFITYFALTEGLVLVLIVFVYILGRTRDHRGTGKYYLGLGDRRRSVAQSHNTTTGSSWSPSLRDSWDRLIDDEARQPAPTLLMPKPRSEDSAPDDDEATTELPLHRLTTTLTSTPASESPHMAPSQPHQLRLDQELLEPPPESVNTRLLLSPTSPRAVDWGQFSFPSVYPAAYSFKLQYRSPEPDYAIYHPRTLLRMLTIPSVVRAHRDTIRGLLFGIISGMLCSQSLLFAKSGIELLITGFTGTPSPGNGGAHSMPNPFTSPLTWFIVTGLIVTALSQLYFLNRSLELCNTLIIAPLTFCSYNVATLLNGLVYYDQFSHLQPLQFGLVFGGTALLSIGVFILSFGLHSLDTDDPPATDVPRNSTGTFDDSCEQQSVPDSSIGSDESGVFRQILRAAKMLSGSVRRTLSAIPQYLNQRSAASTGPSDELEPLLSTES